MGERGEGSYMQARVVRSHYGVMHSTCTQTLILYNSDHDIKVQYLQASLIFIIFTDYRIRIGMLCKVKVMGFRPPQTLCNF